MTKMVVSLVNRLEQLQRILESGLIYREFPQ